MTQPDKPLKLRMKATTGGNAPGSASQETVVYRWGRIFGAVAILLLFIVVLGWLFWPNSGTDTTKTFAGNEQSETESEVSNDDGLPENASAGDTSGKTYDWEAPPESNDDAQGSNSNDPVANGDETSANDIGNSAEPANTSSSASTAEPATENAENADTNSEVPTEPANSATSETTKNASVDEPDLTSQSAAGSSEADPTNNAEDQSGTASEQAAAGSTPALADVTIESDHLKRAVLSRKLQDKEPAGELPAEVTMNNEGIIRVYFFNELENLKGQTVFHDWYRDDERVARVTMRPRGNSLRASSAKYINRNMLGQWRVEATTKSGDRLGSGHFNVSGNPETEQ